MSSDGKFCEREPHPSVSSGEFGKKYESKCMFKPKWVPVNFSVTVILQINSTRKKFVQEIRLQRRLVPVRHCEELYTPMKTSRSGQFVSCLLVECNPREETALQLKPSFIYQDLILPLDKRIPVFI